MIKGSIQEDITLIHAPKIRALQYTKQTLSHKRRIQQKHNNSEGFLTPHKLLTPHFHQCTDHLYRKTNKETQALNDTKDQMDFTDIYRAFHPQTAQYTLFSSVPGTFSSTDHMVGRKASRAKLEKI